MAQTTVSHETGGLTHNSCFQETDVSTNSCFPKQLFSKTDDMTQNRCFQKQMFSETAVFENNRNRWFLATAWPVLHASLMRKQLF